MKKLQNQYKTYDFGGFNLAGIIVVIGPMLTVMFLLSVTIGWGWAAFVPMVVIVAYGISDELLFSLKKQSLRAHTYTVRVSQMISLRKAKLLTGIQKAVTATRHI